MDEVDAMFELGRETIALPLEEKLKFEQGDQGLSFGWVPVNYVYSLKASRLYSLLLSEGTKLPACSSQTSAGA